MGKSKISCRIVRQAGVLLAIQIVQAAAFADVALYERFNYPPGTLLEGQLPDGNRTWSVAGAGGGDASTGRPHAVAGNLAMPIAREPSREVFPTVNWRPREHR